MFDPRKRAGVTLIEVSLAMGVLLFGIISVASLFPVGLILAEKSFRATDAAIIAQMAKSQLEILTHSNAFVFPGGAPRGARKGRLDLPNGLPDAGSKLQCKKAQNEEPLEWSGGTLSSGYLLMTGGAEAGKLFPILTNSASDLTLKVNVKQTRLGNNDSFRVIYNRKPNAIRCIPADFLTYGERIPTINGLELDRHRITLNDLTTGNAQALEATGYCRYSYAVVLDARERGSPNLFRAYVLIYKDFDSTLGAHWWKNSPPVKFYVFFYRRP